MGVCNRRVLFTLLFLLFLLVYTGFELRDLSKSRAGRLCSWWMYLREVTSFMDLLRNCSLVTS